MCRDRVLLFSLGVSLFFHLSMVTLFSIEMHYQPKPIVYFPFDVVDVSDLEQAPVHPDAVLNLPTEAAPFGGERDAAEYLASLPQISLPTLNFEDIAHVSLREPSLAMAASPSLPGREAPRDAWAQFGGEIQDLRNTLLTLPLMDRLPGARRAPTPESSREVAGGDATEVLRPAPGLVARVEWMAEPKDRRLLFAPPVILPWPASAPALVRPISLVFQVSPSGAVSDVVAPVGENQDLIEALAEALRGYRFEPSSGEAVQHAALLVEPEEARP